jgi:site-specific recombinase XerD
MLASKSVLMDDPGAIVAWDKVKGPPTLAKLAASMDRNAIFSLLGEARPYLGEGDLKNTRRAYCSDVAHFLSWVIILGIKLTDVSFQHITRYVQERPGVKLFQVSRRSMNRRLSSIRILFDALIESFSHLYGRNPVRKKHFFKSVSQPRPRPLSMSAVTAFISSISNVTDRVVFGFLLFTGCRKAEVIDIRFKDTVFDDESKTVSVLIRNGKGGHQRRVYLGGQGVTALRDYLHYRFPNKAERPKPDDYLLLNNVGEPWTPGRIQKRFRVWRRRLASVDTAGWTVHRLRHTLLSEMARVANMSVFELQKISGHKSINTLLHYVDIHESKVRSSYFLTIGRLND